MSPNLIFTLNFYLLLDFHAKFFSKQFFLGGCQHFTTTTETRTRTINSISHCKHETSHCKVSNSSRNSSRKSRVPLFYCQTFYYTVQQHNRALLLLNVVNNSIRTSQTDRQAQNTTETFNCKEKESFIEETFPYFLL